MKRHAAVTIAAHEAGTALIDYLTARFTYGDRMAWLQSIAEGRVLVDGEPAAPMQCLSRGAQLSYCPEGLPEPPVSTQFSILYQDRWLLAVDKPGNLPCHPAGRYFNHTLWAMLLREFGGSLAFVHRIDRETSGIVLVARSRESARRFRQRFEAGQVFKRYVAVVEGIFPLSPMTADGFLAPDTSSAVRMKQRYFPAEKKPSSFPAFPCRTRLRAMAWANGLSQVEAIPDTGRRHQIRATFSALGFPLVGDKLYGLDETLFLRFITDQLTEVDCCRLRVSRQALHAAELVMAHPYTGRSLQLVSRLPGELHQLMAKTPPKEGG